MSKLTINLPAPVTGSNSSFYIWGMSAAGKGGTIKITDPNNNVWNYDYTDTVEGQAFNLPNPDGNPNSQPYGWTLDSPSTLTFTVEITSSIPVSSTNDNEGIVSSQNHFPLTSDIQATNAIVMYNDPSQSDNDYNDVVLSICLSPVPPAS